MSDKVTITWTDGRGKEQRREVNQIIDVRDFIGTRGYPWLIIAANVDRLSVANIFRFLEDCEQKGVRRSLGWIQRHRWMFTKPDTVRPHTKCADGRDAEAVRIMQQYPTMSARALSRLLKEHGIKRGKDWVWEHRCDDV